MRSTLSKLGLLLVLVSFCAVSLPNDAAAANKVVMNLGWATPLNSNYGILAKRFKELVEKYSDGSVVVQLRCCGQIGTEDNAFTALQLGTVDAYIITQNNVTPHWPLMNVFVLPYVFHSQSQFEKVIHGSIGEKMKKDLLKDTGVHLLTYGAPSYRDIYDTKRPIHNFSDFKGLKYRVPQNRVMIATIAAFGANPVPLAWSDTPSALQTGTIDASDNGTSVIKEMRFYQFAKYLTILDHFMGVSPLFASDRFMNELSPKQRSDVLKAAKEAGAYQTKVMAKKTKEVRTWLHDKGGMIVTRPDKAPFIAAAKKVQDKFAAKQSAKFRQLLSRIEASEK